MPCFSVGTGRTTRATVDLVEELTNSLSALGDGQGFDYQRAGFPESLSCFIIALCAGSPIGWSYRGAFVSHRGFLSPTARCSMAQMGVRGFAAGLGQNRVSDVTVTISVNELQRPELAQRVLKRR